MTFLYPIWLLGIAGVIIPVALHLLNRNEGKVVRIGSIRFLRESATTRIQKLKLTEILLLVLRCLLIIAISLLLSEPRLNIAHESREKWLVMEPGVQEIVQWQDFIKNAKADGFTSHYLLPHFPSSYEKDSNTTINYWKLVNDLAEKELDSVVVVSFNYLKYFNGKPISKPSNLLWLQADVPVTKEILSETIDRNGVAWVQEVNSAPERVEFNVEKTGKSTGNSIHKGDTILVSIFAQKNFQQEQQIVLASLRAIQQITPRYIRVSTGNTDEAPPASGWWFWLADIPSPPSLNKNSFGYYYSCGERESDSGILVLNSCKTESSPTWRFTQRLTPSLAIENHLTAELAQIMMNPSNEIYARYDNRVLPEAFMWNDKPLTKETKGAVVNARLDHALLIIMISLFILERFISFRRNA